MGLSTMKPGRSGIGRLRNRSTLAILRATRRQGWVLLPGIGMRSPMLLTNSTRRVRATRRSSCSSEWAWLLYHQSIPAMQT